MSEITKKDAYSFFLQRMEPEEEQYGNDCLCCLGVSREDIALLRAEIQQDRNASETWYRLREEALTCAGITDELRSQNFHEYFDRRSEIIREFAAKNPPPWEKATSPASP